MLTPGGRPWLNVLVQAFLLSLAWGLAWAIMAVLIGTLIIDPENLMDEMWGAIGAYPGILSALFFTALLDIRPDRLTRLSVRRAALLGALAGLFVGALALFLASASPRAAILVAGLVAVILSLLSSLSAVVSLLLLRYIASRATSVAPTN